MSPCNVVEGVKRPYGYAYVRKNGKLAYAHRVIYEETKGPIPSGMEIDHLCMNKRCINPEHLELVTGAENKRRAALKLRPNCSKCGGEFKKKKRGERYCLPCHLARKRELYSVS